MQIDGRSVRRDPAVTVLVAGVVLALIGAAGDLIWHALHPAEHVELFSLGSGETPWHIGLFVGIALGAVGAVMWAVRLRSDGGTVLGATIALMLVVTAGAAAWTVAAGDAVHDDTAAASSGSGLPVSDGHGHATNPAPDRGTTTSGGGDSVIPGEGASHTHGTPQPLSAADQARVDAILAEVKAATAAYRDIEVAKADGFIQVTQFIPGLGLHMFNFENAGRFDPLKPQLLLYMPVGDRLKLAGVSYMLPHRTDVPPEGFPGGADVWHFHQDLCFLKGGSVTIATKADCAALGGFHQGQTGWLLHAWIFVKNPEGVFTEDNPAVVAR